MENNSYFKRRDMQSLLFPKALQAVEKALTSNTYVILDGTLLFEHASYFACRNMSVVIVDDEKNPMTIIDWSKNEGKITYYSENANLNLIFKKDEIIVTEYYVVQGEKCCYTHVMRVEKSKFLF